MRSVYGSTATFPDRSHQLSSGDGSVSDRTAQWTSIVVLTLVPLIALSNILAIGNMVLLGLLESGLDVFSRDPE